MWWLLPACWTVTWWVFFACYGRWRESESRLGALGLGYIGSAMVSMPAWIAWGVLT